MRTRDLKVYKLAYGAALDIHRLSLGFPRIEQYGLADQIRRSSRGIPANLMEGLGTYRTVADETRFLRTALGSCEETRVWLDFAKDLGYLDVGKHQSLCGVYDEIGKMIYGLIRKRSAGE